MASKLGKNNFKYTFLLDLWNTYAIFCMDDCNVVLLLAYFGYLMYFNISNCKTCSLHFSKKVHFNISLYI